MTKRHIGELHVYKKNGLVDFEEYNKENINFMFDYCESVLFRTKDSVVIVKGCKILLLKDNALQIDANFYNDELFELYRLNKKLKSIREDGFIFKIKDISEYLEYSREYRRYKIVSAYPYEDKNHKYWRYILKPCL